jgi:hypothetical protein
MATQNLQVYIERLRLHLGDKVPGSYRYTDDWLLVALYCAIEALMARWNYKYLLNTANEVYRNPHHDFLFPEPPVIQRADLRPIVLQAAIIVKEGSLEDMSWNFASWRDAEISYSNLEGSRSKDRSLQRDLDELDTILPWRSKRLAVPKKGHLPGYLGNPFEHD